MTWGEGKCPTPAHSSHPYLPKGGEKNWETRVKFTAQRHRLNKRLRSEYPPSSPPTLQHHITKNLRTPVNITDDRWSYLLIFAQSENIFKKWYMWFPVGGQQEKYRINGGLALGGNITLLSWFIFFVFYQNENIPCKKKYIFIIQNKSF